VTFVALKRTRVVVSVIVFLLILWLFLDPGTSTAPEWAQAILSLQFVPSVMQSVSGFSIGAAGFLVIVAVTLLFGRVYCSTLCPLGTLQDGIIAATRRVRKKHYHRRQKSWTLLHITLLLFCTGLLLLHSGLLLNLLDPFSSFGRIATSLFRPPVVLANNTIAALLEWLHVYALFSTPFNTLTVASTGVAVITLVALLWMASRHGRLYCNAICPVGALLGLLSRFSLYKISIDKKSCISCNMCEQVCKAGCIDKKEKVLDFSRCVSCYNCLTVCPKGGMTFERRRPAATSHVPDGKRREAMYNALLLVAGVSGVQTRGTRKVIVSKATTVRTVKTLPVTPPGAGSIDHLMATCTACTLCVSMCPSHVIVPSFLEYGIAGMMQPRMDYNAGFCNYECTICAGVCPSGSLRSLAVDQKKLTALGTAKFVKDNCVVHTEEKDCGACSEHCPTKAVSMVPYKKLFAPEVKEDYCIGCGACEFACPTTPYKAIYVDGKEVHTLAKKPEVKKLDQTVPEDFPF
jgi:ferredoxin